MQPWRDATKLPNDNRGVASDYQKPSFNDINAELYAQALAAKSSLGLLDGTVSSSALSALRSYGTSTRSYNSPTPVTRKQDNSSRPTSVEESLYGSSPQHANFPNNPSFNKQPSNQENKSASSSTQVGFKPTLDLNLASVDDEDEFLYGDSNPPMQEDSKPIQTPPTSNTSQSRWSKPSVVEHPSSQPNFSADPKFQAKLRDTLTKNLGPMKLDRKQLYPPNSESNLTTKEKNKNFPTVVGKPIEKAKFGSAADILKQLRLDKTLKELIPSEPIEQDFSSQNQLPFVPEVRETRTSALRVIYDPAQSENEISKNFKPPEKSQGNFPPKEDSIQIIKDFHCPRKEDPPKSKNDVQMVFDHSAGIFKRASDMIDLKNSPVYPERTVQNSWHAHQDDSSKEKSRSSYVSKSQDLRFLDDHKHLLPNKDYDFHKSRHETSRSPEKKYQHQTQSENPLYTNKKNYREPRNESPSVCMEGERFDKNTSNTNSQKTPANPVSHNQSSEKMFDIPVYKETGLVTNLDPVREQLIDYKSISFNEKVLEKCDSSDAIDFDVMRNLDNAIFFTFKNAILDKFTEIYKEKTPGLKDEKMLIGSESHSKPPATSNVVKQTSQPKESFKPSTDSHHHRPTSEPKESMRKPMSPEPSEKPTTYPRLQHSSYPPKFMPPTNEVAIEKGRSDFKTEQRVVPEAYKKVSDRPKRIAQNTSCDRKKDLVGKRPISLHDSSSSSSSSSSSDEEYDKKSLVQQLEKLIARKNELERELMHVQKYVSKMKTEKDDCERNVKTGRSVKLLDLEAMKHFQEQYERAMDKFKNLSEESRSIAIQIKEMGPKLKAKTQKKPVPKKKKLEQEIKLPSEPTVLFQCFDTGNHWCEVCNESFATLAKHMLHLHDPAHIKKVQPFKVLKDKEISDEGKEVNVNYTPHPVKGVEFMKPIYAYYCSLCEETVRNRGFAELHLKGHDHTMKYQNFLRENPNYESKRDLLKTAKITASMKEKRRKEMEEKAAKRQKLESDPIENVRAMIHEEYRKDKVNVEQSKSKQSSASKSSNEERSYSKPSESPDKNKNISNLPMIAPKKNQIMIGRAPNFKGRVKPTTNKFINPMDKDFSDKIQSMKSKSIEEIKNPSALIKCNKNSLTSLAECEKSKKRVNDAKMQDKSNKQLFAENKMKPSVRSVMGPEPKPNTDTKNKNKVDAKPEVAKTKDPVINQALKHILYGNEISGKDLAKIKLPDELPKKTSSQAQRMPPPLPPPPPPRRKAPLTEEEKDFLLLGINKRDMQPMVVPRPPPPALLQTPGEVISLPPFPPPLTVPPPLSVPPPLTVPPPNMGVKSSSPQKLDYFKNNPPPVTVNPTGFPIPERLPNIPLPPPTGPSAPKKAPVAKPPCTKPLSAPVLVPNAKRSSEVVDMDIDEDIDNSTSIIVEHPTSCKDSDSLQIAPEGEKSLNKTSMDSVIVQPNDSSCPEKSKVEKIASSENMQSMKEKKTVEGVPGPVPSETKEKCELTVNLDKTKSVTKDSMESTGSPQPESLNILEPVCEASKAPILTSETTVKNSENLGKIELANEESLANPQQISGSLETYFSISTEATDDNIGKEKSLPLDVITESDLSERSLPELKQSPNENPSTHSLESSIDTAETSRKLDQTENVDDDSVNCLKSSDLSQQESSKTILPTSTDVNDENICEEKSLPLDVITESDLSEGSLPELKQSPNENPSTLSLETSIDTAETSRNLDQTENVDDDSVNCLKSSDLSQQESSKTILPSSTTEVTDENICEEKTLQLDTCKLNFTEEFSPELQSSEENVPNIICETSNANENFENLDKMEIVNNDSVDNLQTLDSSQPKSSEILETATETTSDNICKEVSLDSNIELDLIERSLPELRQSSEENALALTCETSNSSVENFENLEKMEMADNDPVDHLQSLDSSLQESSETLKTTEATNDNICVERSLDECVELDLNEISLPELRESTVLNTPEFSERSGTQESDTFDETESIKNFSEDHSQNTNSSQQELSQQLEAVLPSEENSVSFIFERSTTSENLEGVKIDGSRDFFQHQLSENSGIMVPTLAEPDTSEKASDDLKPSSEGASERNNYVENSETLDKMEVVMMDYIDHSRNINSPLESSETLKTDLSTLDNDGTANENNSVPRNISMDECLEMDLSDKASPGLSLCIEENSCLIPQKDTCENAENLQEMESIAKDNIAPLYSSQSESQTSIAEADNENIAENSLDVENRMSMCEKAAIKSMGELNVPKICDIEKQESSSTIQNIFDENSFASEPTEMKSVKEIDVPTDNDREKQIPSLMLSDENRSITEQTDLTETQPTTKTASGQEVDFFNKDIKEQETKTGACVTIKKEPGTSHSELGLDFSNEREFARAILGSPVIPASEDSEHSNSHEMLSQTNLNVLLADEQYLNLVQVLREKTRALLGKEGEKSSASSSNKNPRVASPSLMLPSSPGSEIKVKIEGSKPERGESSGNQSVAGQPKLQPLQIQSSDAEEIQVVLSTKVLASGADFPVIDLVDSDDENKEETFGKNDSDTDEYEAS